ncbi:MAG: DUF2344 domain-containing protein [Synergistaceae bacterium]|nr:DUF2344 domain-containing protein [Synergistaceae bacterium]
MRVELRHCGAESDGVVNVTGQVARVRLIYEKRGGACFVPHVALASLFTRAARRAGIVLHSTDGFSPHAKISFGPELPAGVVALCEPVDLWVKSQEKRDKDGWIFDDLAFGLAFGLNALNALNALNTLNARLNEQMPDGFRIKKCLFPAEGAPALGKECGAAHYLIWERGLRPVENLLDHLRNHFGGEVLFSATRNEDKEDKEDQKDKGASGSRISVVLANPAKNGIGGWVKTLGSAEGRAEGRDIYGWKDLCIVRTALGRWDGVRMKTLVEEDVAWL